jgi:hypothetical protein
MHGCNPFKELTFKHDTDAPTGIPIFSVCWVEEIPTHLDKDEMLS